MCLARCWCALRQQVPWQQSQPVPAHQEARSEARLRDLGALSMRARVLMVTVLIVTTITGQYCLISGMHCVVTCPSCSCHACELHGRMGCDRSQLHHTVKICSAEAGFCIATLLHGCQHLCSFSHQFDLDLALPCDNTCRKRHDIRKLISVMTLI